MLRSEDFFLRICDALGIENTHGAKTKIADIAGITSTAVALWQKGEMPGRNSLESIARIAEQSNTSIHWLLTGEGDKYLSSNRHVNFDQIIRDLVGKMIDEKFNSFFKASAPERRTIDEFDFVASIEKHDNAIPVLYEWFAHDRLPAPMLTAMDFSGWKTMSTDEKIESIRLARRMMDLQKIMEEGNETHTDS